jgi:hypothetical protein
MGMQPRLPSRFPVGTHYIVEGEPRKGGKLRIVSRYVVMPSGIRYDLMPPGGAGAQTRRPCSQRPLPHAAARNHGASRRVAFDAGFSSVRPGQWLCLLATGWSRLPQSF